jgi:hypothetical protein
MGGSTNQLHDELSRIAAVVPRTINPQQRLGALGLFVHVDDFPGKCEDSWKHSDLGSTDLPFPNRNSAATEAKLAHVAVGQPGNQTTNEKLLWIQIYNDAVANRTVTHASGVGRSQVWHMAVLLVVRGH